MEFPSSQNHLKTAGIPGVFCIFLRTLRDPECPVTTSEMAWFGASSTRKKEAWEYITIHGKRSSHGGASAPFAHLTNQKFESNVPMPYMVLFSHG